MNKLCRMGMCAAVAWMAASVVGAGVARAADSASVKAIFAEPPRQYSTAPLWVWNDMLTEQQVLDSLRDLARQQVKQAFVHPRPGLMTPYLSDDWFRLWKAALAEAERLDMNLWIYDENSYPSGFAGGFVPEAMPESRGRGLYFAEVAQPAKLADNVIGVFRLTDNGYEEITADARTGENLSKARYLVARIERAKDSPWNGGKCYVDLLYPGVTQKFLDITLEAYRREVGSQFGRRVPGSFCDEPEIRPAGGLPWTDDLPEQFQKRWGYSLTAHLPSLARPVGDWKQVRHDYFQLLNELFIERWSKPYSTYCEKNHLEWTGHYWDHEWPNCVAVPDNMAMYAWHQRPAIDCLMNQYKEDTHAQFGNVRMVKELASVANQLGKKRTLCEAYGAGGWDLRFEDMKRIGDWLYALGVNTLDQHVSYVSIRGARKWDHPQSFSYHEPWWEAYHVMAQYFTRLSAAMSQGEQINHVLLIEPTTTAWMYQGGGSRLKELGDKFFQTVMSLEQAQVEYDLGCEDIIARHGSIPGRAMRAAASRGLSRFLGQDATKMGLSPSARPSSDFVVGERKYDVVVLPPMTETLDAKTMDLLESFLQQGGAVICCGAPPALIDGLPSDRGSKAAKLAGWKQIEPDALPAELLKLPADGFAIQRSPDDKGILFHQRRHLDDGELVLLVNTSIDSEALGEVRSKHSGWAPEQWDLETGTIKKYSRDYFWHLGTGLTIPFRLPPCGSLLLFLPAKPTAPPTGPAEDALIQQTYSSGKLGQKKVAAIPPAGPPAIRRIEPNVLTLDYFDVTAGGETKKNAYCYPACEFAFQKNGMAHNPWDHAVQFRDELISKKFPPASGCAATYRFTIEREVPKPLWIVIERPDLYTITCNGQRVGIAPSPPTHLPEGEETSWWLDKAFGKLDITAAARPGENTVTIKAAPFTIYHELMPAYVLGEFSLKPVEAGFAIAPAKPLALGRWNEQGLPLYSAGVAYTEKFEIEKGSGGNAPPGRYRVRLPQWYGSVAKVTVNGRPAGYISHAPWQCDVTGLIVPGSNTIEVLVIGTLKNTLGPHHGKPALGSAWPATFHTAPPTGPPPGAAYQTLGYGLFEPFLLENVARQDAIE